MLNAISSSIAKKPPRLELWRKLTELRISQRNPSRRGCRGGQCKLKPFEVCMGRGTQKSKHLSQLNTFKNSELQEEDDLHNAILLSLNIQNDTSGRSRTNNSIVYYCGCDIPSPKGWRTIISRSFISVPRLNGSTLPQLWPLGNRGF